ncbi:MAG: SUMF1/EgtB/PvdO family nonheme iron enzyme [Anaerolineales bacterium]|nr:SUMF1/EgtB/PvdO family nonheme iron enzyme [Anaerolineales bacterium]
MNYQDFELEVRPLGGREYELVIIRSPAGEGREQATLPFSELQLKNHLLNVEVAMLRSGNVRRMALSEEEQAVQDFGRALFDFLLPAELRSAYRTSLSRVHAVGDGLRVKLRLNDPKLAFLPWEFLFDSNRREYVCLSIETPLVRYLEIQRSIPPLKVEPPLRILGMVVNPKNYPHQLDVAKEKQRVEEAVKDLQAAGLVELQWLEGQTWRDLQRELRRGPWHVFHFIGHGAFDTARDEGRLIFANSQGNADPFGATQLARLLADHKPLRLALLNACEGARGGTELFSGTAPILVSRGLPAVVAMQYAITDGGAIEFARAFYESLADAYPVDAAVGEARKAMSFAFEQTVEWGVPVLYMRARDGVLFELAQQPKRPVEAVREPPLPTQPEPIKQDKVQQPQIEPPQQMQPVSPSALRQAMVEGLNLDELKTVCFDLGAVDYDNLSGNTKSSKIISLIGWFQRRNQLDLLTGYLNREYPHVLRNVDLRSNESDRLNDDVDLFKNVLHAVSQTLGRGGVTGVDEVAHYTDLSQEIIKRVLESLQEQNLVVIDKTLGGIWLINLTDKGEAQVFSTIGKYSEQAKEKPLSSAPTQLPKSSNFTPQPFDGIEWIEIPAGEFWMGAATHDKQAYNDEKPLHKLYLPTYWMGKTPITNAQYLTFVQDSNQGNPEHWKNGRYPDGKGDHPVVYVSWQDAMAYCQWLSKKIGMEVTLPSEVEWEKAARGGIQLVINKEQEANPMPQRIYPWGDKFEKGYCNNKDAGIRNTSPVSQFKKGASPYGLWDMNGNVWEWTRSIFKKYPYKPDDGRENLDDTLVLRVLRGGSWFVGSRGARVSYRGRDDSGYRSSYLGFRVVVVRPPSQP